MIGYIYSLSMYGDIFYVGSSWNAIERLKGHKTRFGYNTVMEIIEEVDVPQRWDLQNIEMYWIEQFKQWGFTLKNKDSHKSYNNAPSDIAKYITDLTIERYKGTKITMKLFTKVMWDIIKEHKENSEKK